MLTFMTHLKSSCALRQRIVPDYDRERVYTSSIEKLINWYNTLVKYVPELFEPVEQQGKSVGKLL